MNGYIALLLIMLLVAAAGGWHISVRKPVEKPVKIMLFVLYFWGLAFVQLALFAIYYLLRNKIGF